MDNPPALNRASQKLTTAAILLRAMPEPSMPVGRNLHREAWILIEQAAMQQAESSASRVPLAPSVKASGTAPKDCEASVHTPLGDGGKAPSVRPAAGAKAPSVPDRV